MNDLDSILQQATVEIKAGYFQLQVAGADAPIYRERVYCYELYHQMRLCWPKEGCAFVLNGEVDKGGHPILGPKGIGGIPDFLIHRPGDMNGNHAIIEVKGPFARDDQIEVDLQKLTRFTREVGYERAIYLVYGTEAHELVERIYKIAGSMPDLAPTELWHHQQVGQPAVRLKNIADTAAAAAKPRSASSRAPARRATGTDGSAGT